MKKFFLILIFLNFNFIHVFSVEPDVFAQRMLRQIAKNKSVIIEPATVRRVASIGRHFPQLVDWMAGRMFTKLHHQN